MSSITTTNWRHTEQEVNCDAPVCIVISSFSIPNKTGKKKCISEFSIKVFLSPEVSGNRGESSEP